METQNIQLPNNWQPEDNYLTDKVVLVTGAGDGIGKAVAIEFARLGATIILLGKTTKKLEIVYDKIEELGYPQPAIYPMNIEGAVEKDYEDLANTIDKNFGHLDILVNNAAMLGDLAPISTYQAKTWLRTMQVDLNAPFMMTQALIPVIQKAGKGTILFSVDDKTRAYWGAYGVAKYALKALIAILADELDDERFPINVNGVNPGPARTNMRAISYPGESFEEVEPPSAKTPAYVYALDVAINNKVINF